MIKYDSSWKETDKSVAISSLHSTAIFNHIINICLLDTAGMW